MRRSTREPQQGERLLPSDSGAAAAAAAARTRPENLVQQRSSSSAFISCRRRHPALCKTASPGSSALSLLPPPGPSPVPPSLHLRDCSRLCALETWQGGPALSLSPVSTSLRRAAHDSLSFARPLFPEGDNGSVSTFPTFCGGRRSSNRSSIVPRASKGASFSLENEKPQWWWRTAACLPYFLPLHETWNYGETAYFLQPYLERFEFLTNPVLEVPTWFSMLYFFVGFLWLVRKKELPHFLRFHIMMGMLLENSLQIMWTVSRWMPLTLFGVKIGVYFWTAVSFAFLFCILRCICYALAGKYPDIPCISDAANVHIPRS
ncbi:hypothetical protein Taro_015580 [Colocasia esculenta]|uniref:Protein TIC 20 n=1 Tax=Colocasia esculenta TaxID=4460 RepID=A0A843UI65_COLES|nr:hypothetical protein [Colocasia esculenta]